MHIGHKIKEIREEKKMSQKELALRAGYSTRQSIYDMELKEQPSHRVVSRIARALGVDVNIFYADNPIMVRDKREDYEVKKHRMDFLLYEIKDIWSKMNEENIRLRQSNNDLKRQLGQKE